MSETGIKITTPHLRRTLDLGGHVFHIRVIPGSFMSLGVGGADISLTATCATHYLELNTGAGMEVFILA